MSYEVPAVVALDANALISLCGDPSDERTKLEYLLEMLDRKRGLVIIPTPAVSEFLVAADQASHDLMEVLQSKSSVRICPFDLAAAYECSQINAAAIGRGNKRDGVQHNKPWQHIKFDRQIVAIAKCNGAQLIVSDDEGVRACAKRLGIQALSMSDLEFPEHERQAKMPLEAPHPHFGGEAEIY
ncbi:type II toxin-antitoxin system VapC family toxin [Stenotrophomonas maltophilia]|nr:type II toxin-antitoxin system VapC family toxin [Stenotrophomonas maltophilia]NMT72889.1 type II toxin-antitoxin system VapC family toxin [Stenotrophomonas maltophilia]